MNYNEIIKEAQDILQENVYDAIDKYVKDSKKRKELRQKAFDNYVADHVEQMNRIEKKLDGVKKGSIEAAEKSFDIKQSHDTNKNIKGQEKTDMRRAIKEAQDIMSNLFEVEYYGANDVEEEQNNKIKRQGKDKHGNKVDLVSVQDELFPYEGNAKEQYNKKIIAKINDMIEGKATLEDLIQLVRNKKTPVKEGFEGAIELLEDLYNSIKQKHGEPKYEGSDSHPANKAAELMFKRDEAVGKEYEEARGRESEEGSTYKNRFTTKNTRGENKTASRSSKYRKFSDDWKLPKTDDEKVEASIERHNKKVSESFEDAIELLESVLDAILKSDKSDEKKSELRSKLVKARAAERELADKKAEQSWLKGDLKNPDVSIIRNPEYTKNASGEMKTRIRSANNNYNLKNGSRKFKPEWKQVADSIKRHEKKSK